MRGPRARGCSDGASSFEVVIALEDGDRGEVEVAAIATADAGMAADRACAALPLAWRAQLGRLEVRCGSGSPFTSARKRAIVSVPTTTPTMASNFTNKPL